MSKLLNAKFGLALLIAWVYFSAWQLSQPSYSWFGTATIFSGLILIAAFMTAWVLK